MKKRWYLYVAIGLATILIVLLILIFVGVVDVSGTPKTEKDKFIAAFNKLSESKINFKDEYQFDENVKALFCSFENDTGLMLGTDSDYNVATIVISADFSKGEATGGEFGTVMKNALIAYTGSTEKYKEIYSRLGLEEDEAWEIGSMLLYDDTFYAFHVDGYVYSLTIYKGPTESNSNRIAPKRTPKRYFAYQIQLGMTQKQVEDLWGLPDDRDTYKSEYGYYVTYTYVDDYERYIIIDFENGVVTSVGEY